MLGGAKTELPCEGGISVYYWTERQLDELREFAVAQEQVVRQEAVRRLAIPLYHEDGSEVTDGEIRNGFIDEEMKLAQPVYARTPNHELYRKKIGLSEEAFCVMVNMGYKVDGTVKYPKSFCEWMEKETEKKIKEETLARRKIIDKYKPHQENRQLMRKKVRKALLKKYSIT